SVLRAATETFIAEGYSRTTIAKIARRGRVTSGAIYHHFDDKQALFVAVAEHVMVQFVASAKELAAAHTDPWKKLSAGIEAVLKASSAPEVKLAFLEAPL